MNRYTKPLPSLDEVRSLFEYHDDVYHRGGRVCLGGLRRKYLSSGSSSGIAGGIDRLGYVRTLVPGYKGLFAIHRMVWLYFHGAFDSSLLIDHVNGNPSDNTIANLRCVTDSENQMNRKSSKAGSTVKYIGVCRTLGGYNAFISDNSAPVFLGKFSDPVEAAVARDDAVAAKYGSVASLNRDLFPEDFR